MNTIDKNEINELVKRVGQGDKQATEDLYNRMNKVIYYFLLRYNLKENQIEDIVSSTFLVVIEKSKEKMIYKNCFSWILTIAKNVMLSNFRAETKVDFDDETINHLGFTHNLQKMSLKNMIEKMDKISQQIIYFTFYEKLPCHKISKILHISESTVKRRKNDIIIYLKEIYKDEKFWRRP